MKKAVKANDRIVGNARSSEIEVRYNEPAHLTLDEVVAFNADVHLEQMTDSQYALIVETSKERACFWIGSLSNRAEVGANEVWRNVLSKDVAAERRRRRLA